MSTIRVFLLASSLARLTEKERGGHRIQQGYFPDRPDRGTHVQVEGHTAHLILVMSGPHGPAEEVADIPLSHAEALLDLAAEQVEYLTISLDTGTQTAAILHFISRDRSIWSQWGSITMSKGGDFSPWPGLARRSQRNQATTPVRLP
jgi:hypothetical protein